MATASGIWNQTVPANSLVNAKPAVAPSSSTSDSNASAISANDFLTLLVTEMKNQDPTANNDPNAYVNQLVQVNSLEQLININQTLTTGLGVSGTPPKKGSEPDPVAGASTANPQPAAPTGNHIVGAGASRNSPNLLATSNHVIATTDGNLSVPPSNPAAQRVSHSLGHHTRVD